MPEFEDLLDAVRQSLGSLRDQDRLEHQALFNNVQIARARDSVATYWIVQGFLLGIDLGHRHDNRTLQDCGFMTALARLLGVLYQQAHPSGPGA